MLNQLSLYLAIYTPIVITKKSYQATSRMKGVNMTYHLFFRNHYRTLPDDDRNKMLVRLYIAGGIISKFILSCKGTKNTISAISKIYDKARATIFVVFHALMLCSEPVAL
jgi:hypothetical protein